MNFILLSKYLWKWIHCNKDENLHKDIYKLKTTWKSVFKYQCSEILFHCEIQLGLHWGNPLGRQCINI